LHTYLQIQVRGKIGASKKHWSVKISGAPPLRGLRLPLPSFYIPLAEREQLWDVRYQGHFLKLIIELGN
jgi:hypothetical protein